MGEHERCRVSQGLQECGEDWDLLKSKARVEGGGQAPIPLRIALPTVVMEGKTPARPTLPTMGVEDRHQASGGEGETPNPAKSWDGSKCSWQSRNRRQWMPGDRISGLWLPVSPCACCPHPTARLKSFTLPFGSLPLWGPSQAQ